MILDKDHSYASSWAEENFSDSSMWSPLDWTEWHANGIAPRILMPKNRLELRLESYIEH